MEETDNPLKLFVTIFFARIRIVLITAFIVGVLGIITAYFYPPVYLLQGSLIVKSKKIQVPPEILKEGQNSRIIFPPSREDIISETKILSSKELIRDSLQSLMKEGGFSTEASSKLKQFIREFITLPMNRFLVFIGLKPETELSKIDILTNEVSENLSTEIVPGSNVIEVTLLYDNPTVGVRILNSILDNYLKFRLTLFTDKTAYSFFTNQLEKYNKQLTKLERERVRLLNQVPLSDAEEETLSQDSLIETIRGDLLKLETEYLEKQRSLFYLNQLYERYLKTQINTTTPFPYGFEDQEINQFAEKLNSLLFDYSDSIKVYNVNSTKIKDLQNQISDLRSKLNYLIKHKIEQQKYELDTIKHVIDKKTKNLSLLLKNNKAFKQIQSKLERLDFEIKLSKDNYESFFHKLEESKIEKTSQISETSNVQLISRATVPDEPYFPKRIVVIPLGIFTGLLLGLCLAFIGEFFNHTFKTPGEVTRRLGLPLVGSIPFESHWRLNVNNNVHYRTDRRKLPKDTTYIALKKKARETVKTR